MLPSGSTRIEEKACCYKCQISREGQPFAETLSLLVIVVELVSAVVVVFGLAVDVEVSVAVADIVVVVGVVW